MLPLLLTCLFLLQPYEIVVVGKRPRGESVKADQSGNTVELKGKNILTRGSTLGEAVTHSPGISHRSTGGAGHLSQVMIRGSSPSQVVWFLDGFRLGEGTGGSMDAAQLPLAGVATVGIYKSGVPLEFGAEGIGGGINIVPMAPRGNTFAFHHTMGSYGTLMDSFVLGLRTWGIAHLLSGSLVTTNG
ncbi:TonB-dependent receptor plug domain-containing protein, partial [Myxococcota bacterium]|nr:TonB-dependent receptor plug domain-containing protein [Myxococcota bacterium]